jgi:hypothetical protein
MRLVFGRFLPELPLLGHLRSFLLLACRHLVAHPVGNLRSKKPNQTETCENDGSTVIL